MSGHSWAAPRLVSMCVYRAMVVIVGSLYTGLASNTNNPSGYVLAGVTNLDTTCLSFVAVGSSIYNIGTSNYGVSVMDCRSHTWREVPSSQLDIMSAYPSVLDEEIYVAERYKDVDGYFKNYVEVFDTKSQIWDHVPIPWKETTNGDFFYRSACMDGKFYVDCGVAANAISYNLKEGRWDLVGLMKLSYNDCVIGNVLYSCYKGGIRWFDTEVKMWRHLNGLEVLPNFPPTSSITFGDYGGKMAVL